MDLNSPKSVREVWGLMQTNMQEWARYTAHSMGLRNYLAQGMQLAYPFSVGESHRQHYQAAFSCASLYYDTANVPAYCTRAYAASSGW